MAIFNWLQITVILGLVAFIILFTGLIIRVWEWYSSPRPGVTASAAMVAPAAYTPPNPGAANTFTCPKCGLTGYFAFCPIDGTQMQVR